MGAARVLPCPPPLLPLPMAGRVMAKTECLAVPEMTSEWKTKTGLRREITRLPPKRCPPEVFCMDDVDDNNGDNEDGYDSDARNTTMDFGAEKRKRIDTWQKDSASFVMDSELPGQPREGSV
ncbi:hypothetical protein C8R45DRAFT_930758 [Mycena sanguinolenta]|nr:hypothetical protein C8R45DRAFT_930758 [Mycena sanguinolenta]